MACVIPLGARRNFVGLLLNEKCHCGGRGLRVGESLGLALSRRSDPAHRVVMVSPACDTSQNLLEALSTNSKRPSNAVSRGVKDLAAVGPDKTGAREYQTPHHRRRCRW
jgi:hypothetical protein